MHGVVESGERVGGAAPGRRCSAHHALSLRHPKGQCVFEACIKPATVTLEDAVSRFTSAAVRGSGKRGSRHPGLAQARSVRLASLPPSSRSLPPTIFPTLKRASPQTSAMYTHSLLLALVASAAGISINTPLSDWTTTGAFLLQFFLPGRIILKFCLLRPPQDLTRSPGRASRGISEPQIMSPAH